MSVSRRVIFSITILMLMAIGVIGYQLWIVNTMRRTTTDLSRVSFVAAQSLLQMSQEAEEIDDFSRKYLGLSDPDMRALLDEGLTDRINSFDQNFHKLEDALSQWDTPEEIAVLSTAWIEYQTQMESARHLPAEQGLDEAPPELSDAIDRLKYQAQRSNQALSLMIEKQVQHNEEISRQAGTISLVAATLFVLMGGTIMVLTLRAINIPLRNLTRGTRTVASGEFSHRLPVSGPLEFAELARDFNSMSEKLEELDQMKKDFVAHVSHELKAPLAAIRQTLAVTLEQVPGPINDAQKRLLQLSRNSAERLSAMVANLLDVSRLEAGTMEYEMRPNDIVAIVRQAVDEFSLKAAERGIKIVTKSDETSVPVVCDADRMIQVLGNLLDNALKFSPQDSAVTIDVAVSSSHSGSSPVITISVADKGSGVPDDHKEAVFQKFHQVKGRGRRTAGQGVGLGLAICKTIVDAHRGHIWVEDNPEGGSIFRLEMRSTRVKETIPC